MIQRPPNSGQRGKMYATTQQNKTDGEGVRSVSKSVRETPPSKGRNRIKKQITNKVRHLRRRPSSYRGVASHIAAMLTP